MSNERETELLCIIDKALVELAEMHKADHISCFLISGAVCIEDLTNIKDPKFTYFRGSAENE